MKQSASVSASTDSDHECVKQASYSGPLQIFILARELGRKPSAVRWIEAGVVGGSGGG